MLMSASNNGNGIGSASAGGVNNTNLRDLPDESKAAAAAGSSAGGSSAGGSSAGALPPYVANWQQARQVYHMAPTRPNTPVTVPPLQLGAAAGGSAASAGYQQQRRFAVQLPERATRFIADYAGQNGVSGMRFSDSTAAAGAAAFPSYSRGRENMSSSAAAGAGTNDAAASYTAGRSQTTFSPGSVTDKERGQITEIFDQVMERCLAKSEDLVNMLLEPSLLQAKQKFQANLFDHHPESQGALFFEVVEYCKKGLPEKHHTEYLGMRELISCEKARFDAAFEIFIRSIVFENLYDGLMIFRRVATISPHHIGNLIQERVRPSREGSAAAADLRSSAASSAAGAATAAAARAGTSTAAAAHMEDEFSPGRVTDEEQGRITAIFDMMMEKCPTGDELLYALEAMLLDSSVLRKEQEKQAPVFGLLHEPDRALLFEIAKHCKTGLSKKYAGVLSVMKGMFPCTDDQFDAALEVVIRHTVFNNLHTRLMLFRRVIDISRHYIGNLLQKRS